MRDSNVYTATIETIVNQFIDEDLANKVGDMLGAANVSTGTVHFTLAYLMAQDIGFNSEGSAEKMAVQLISFQQFMYKVASEIVHLASQKQAH